MAPSRSWRGAVSTWEWRNYVADYSDSHRSLSHANLRDKISLRGHALYQSENYYDNAQICLNGHVISDVAGTHPVHTTPFCTQCGAQTKRTCQSCDAGIRGYYHSDIITGYYRRPEYCHSCGAPYPWTERSLDALRQLAHEAKELTPEEQDQLAESFDALLTDTPRTEIAIARLKRFLPRIGSEIGDAIKQVLVNIATEAAKKQLGL